MKKFVLSVALTAGMAVAAHAQVTIDYTRQNRNSYFRVSYSSGYGYGYGYGYGGYGYGGFGYGGTGYGSGLIYGSDFGYAGMGGPFVYSYGGPGFYSDPYSAGYPPYGGGYRYHGAYGRPYAATEVAGPVNRSGPVADRLPEYASAREIEEGRRKLKAGDYRGAVDDFRAAVAAHTENPLAQAWFAVALALTGDAKNGDKALRSAAAAGFSADRLSLADGLRDEKERARVVAALGRSEGSVSAAWALALLGDAAKLKQMSEKDAVAKQLLPK